MSSDLALWLTLISSNYPCLKHIFMASKVFELLKFYCISPCHQLVLSPLSSSMDTWCPGIVQMRSALLSHHMRQLFDRFCNTSSRNTPCRRIEILTPKDSRRNCSCRHILENKKIQMYGSFRNMRLLIHSMYAPH